MDDMTRLRLINKAIWLRDNHRNLSDARVLDLVREIDNEKFFSARQISLILNNRMSHQKIAKHLSKQIRTGGRFNPNSLEDIRTCFTDKKESKVDFMLVKSIIRSGTSQNVIAKLTGINQSLISKGIKL
jgi:hypothetical protein